MSNILHNGSCFFGGVDVARVQQPRVFGCLAQFLMELELEDEADKIPADRKHVTWVPRLLRHFKMFDCLRMTCGRNNNYKPQTVVLYTRYSAAAFVDFYPDLISIFLN